MTSRLRVSRPGPAAAASARRPDAGRRDRPERGIHDESESPRRLLLLLAANFGFVFLARTTVGLLAPFDAATWRWTACVLESRRPARTWPGLFPAWPPPCSPRDSCPPGDCWFIDGLLRMRRAAHRRRAVLCAAGGGACLRGRRLGSRTAAVTGAAGPASLASRRGLSMGLVQSVGGSLVAAIPDHRCWSASPGATAGGPVACSAWRRCWRPCWPAADVCHTARPGPPPQPSHSRGNRRRCGHRGQRNIRVCAGISLVMVGWLVCGWRSIRATW